MEDDNVCLQTSHRLPMTLYLSKVVQIGDSTTYPLTFTNKYIQQTVSRDSKHHSCATDCTLHPVSPVNKV